MLRELYIIRHGQPQSGTGLAYDRIPGPPLSSAGHTEAQESAAYLMNRGIGLIYTSPLERTLQTARIIAATLNVPMLVDPGLAEHRGDEKYEDVKTRVRDLLARVDSQPVESVAFVTHGSPIKAFLQILSFESIDLVHYTYPDGNHSPTAGIWHGQRDLFGVWHMDMAFQPTVAMTASRPSL